MLHCPNLANGTFSKELRTVTLRECQWTLVLRSHVESWVTCWQYDRLKPQKEFWEKSCEWNRESLLQTKAGKQRTRRRDTGDSLALAKLRLALTCKMNQSRLYNKTCFTYTSLSKFSSWWSKFHAKNCVLVVWMTCHGKRGKNDSLQIHYQIQSGTAHCNSEILTSVSNVTSLSFFMCLQGFGTGNSSSTLPPPQFWLLLAPLNSWMVTMWAVTQMCGLSWPLKIAIMIFADFCPVLVFGTPGWLFAFLNVSRLWADEF